MLTLDPAQSSVKWKLGAFLHTVNGTFAMKRGTISFDSSAAGKAEGEVILDLTSGRSGEAARDANMQRDVLQTQTYPDAVFTVDRVSGHFIDNGPSQLDAHGQLRIHGASHELTLRIDVVDSGTQLTARSQFTVPYVAWGMKNPSTFLLHVNDHVELNVNAVGTSMMSDR